MPHLHHQVQMEWGQAGETCHSEKVVYDCLPCLQPPGMGTWDTDMYLWLGLYYLVWWKHFSPWLYRQEWVTRTPGKALDQYHLAINDGYAGKVQIFLSITSNGTVSVLACLPSSCEQVVKCVYNHYHQWGTRVVEVRRFDMLVEGGGCGVYVNTFLNSYFSEKYGKVLPCPSISPDLNLV